MFQGYRSSTPKSPDGPCPGVALECCKVDVIHTMHLGVMLHCCTHAVWRLLDSNVFGLLGSAGERLPAAALRLRGELMAFYKQHHASGGAELAQVAYLTVSMLGGTENRVLKTKQPRPGGSSCSFRHNSGRRRRRLAPRARRSMRPGPASSGLSSSSRTSRPT